MNKYIPLGRHDEKRELLDDFQDTIGDLITALRDMIELVDQVAVIVDRPIIDPRLIKARAAIAKAEGK